MELDTEENETSVLDLLLVVAENLKLLILGPVLVGLVALSIGYALPQSYTSQAIVALSTPTPTPTQAAAMMVSPLVLDEVIRSHNLSAGLPTEAARTKLANQIKAVVGKDGLLRLDVTANAPLEAQTLANAIIDTWLKSTVPSEAERADLTTRLDYAKSALASVRQLLESLPKEGGIYLRKPLTRAEAGTTIVAIGALQDRYFAEVLSIPRSLRGLTRDVVVQPPTLPTQPIAPRNGLIAILAALGSGLALLLWVYMRQSWRNAARDPDAAEKQAKLRAAIGLKGRPQ